MPACSALTLIDAVASGVPCNKLRELIQGTAANVNAATSIGMTALDKAVAAGSLEAVQLLIEIGGARSDTTWWIHSIPYGVPMLGC